jgi:uncharacterized protein YndB with AHSA1/START domain
VKITGQMWALDATRGAVRAEDVYDTGIDDLWAACTDPDRLARWIGKVSGDLRAGGAFQAELTSSWTGPGRIDACEKPTHLLVTMEPGTPDETRIEAWLTAEGDRTRLVVEERGLPRDRLHFYEAGWQAHLEDLARSLAGEESSWKERWTELTPAYRDRAAEAIRLSSVTLNAPDAIELARFYAEITGGTARGNEGWATVKGPNAHIAFQQVRDHRPAQWPEGDVPMQMHLDFFVDDLAATEARVLAAGATRLPFQPNADHCFVYTDPAGHPFCLSTWDLFRD